jgi:signal transduction histidine kinase
MKHNSTGQFGWVVLLLATAVILPTVCLLWFMTQAVRNERLAVRQKLVDVYQQKADAAIERIPPIPPDEQRAISWFTVPASQLLEAAMHNGTNCAGLVVYNEKGEVSYPVTAKQPAYMAADDPRLAVAWKLEFVDANYVGAADVYKAIGNRTSDSALAYEAKAAQARCLVKAGHLDDAKAIALEMSDPSEALATDMFTIADTVMRARVMLAQLYADTKDVRLEKYLRKVMSGPYVNTGNIVAAKEVPCTADTRVWALARLSDIVQSAGLKDSFGWELLRATEVTASDTVSLAAVECYPTTGSLSGWPANTVRRLRTQQLYGVHFGEPGKQLLCVIRPERLPLDTLMNDIQDSIVSCRILDNEGRLVAGDANVTTEAFVKASMGKWMPDWRMELYFRDASVFEAAAHRQAALYTWTAILVIALILAATAMAGVSVSRQMKVNRLKNDFIATVTHELKTPLSSMRVLVDTLLAGDCRDEKQEKEYLEMIAKENLRLSRLIDNFLTFSRMERNKKAFDIQPCEPAKIVADAAEAVKTKFGNNKCAFEFAVADAMPLVMADHDSAVTVLVNLLDNACKYSGTDKQISLKAFAEDGEVCFAVKDNGYGITKRVMKRIFERFYQADQSLARSAEGCGLGLSIVKFIVDAHKGRITVESKPSEGSCFTVRLPAARQDQG